MNAETITALTALAVSMTWTPGPNNMMLAASGANAGWSRGLGHAMGVAWGFPAMLILVSMGLGPVFQAVPSLALVLGWIGFAVMIWFAWTIATARAADGTSTAKPLTFLQAAAFQWINPKAWTFAIWVAASFVTGIETALIAALVFLVSGLGSSQVWLIFGSVMGRVLGTGIRLRIFNIAMAVLLVGSAIWLMLDR